MNLEALRQLDLSDREIAIYHALLTMGPSSIRDIASKTEINRGTTYETLKALVAKGLVNYLPKGKRKVFQAGDPEHLLDMAEDKRHALENTLLDLKSEIIPELKQLNPGLIGGNVRFYEGDDGVEHVLRDILNSVGRRADKTYSVISTQALRKHLYRPFPNFTKQRIQRGINVRVIAIGEGGDEVELAERKWLKGKGDASYIAIYPPKVAMISLADNNYPVVVVIDSDAIANTQQMMFDTLWGAL